MLKNRSKLLMVAFILGASCLIYMIIKLIIMNRIDPFEDISLVMRSAFLGPQIYLLALAVIFNGVAFFDNRKWACITALALYCIAGVVSVMYTYFVIPMIILTALAIDRIPKKLEKKSETISEENANSVD